MIPSDTYHRILFFLKASYFRLCREIAECDITSVADSMKEKTKMHELEKMLDPPNNPHIAH